MSIDYTVTTSKDVTDSVDALRASLKEEGFGVLAVLDFHDILKQKGVDLGREYKLLEVCNPKAAKDIMDKDLRVGLLLPCTIAVYEDQRATRISLLKPTSLLSLLSGSHLEEVGGKIESSMKRAVD